MHEILVWIDRLTGGNAGFICLVLAAVVVLRGLASLSEWEGRKMTIASLLLVVVGGSLIVRATLIPVRNNIDQFIGDLNRQGRWAATGSIVTLLAAVLDLLGRL